MSGLSFSHLADMSNVTKEQIMVTLKEYAESGAAIHGDTVNTLIDRIAASLSEGDKKQLRQLAVIGRLNQTRLGFPTDANEYQKVVRRFA